jgi:tetratricopeptide (TPR) repeat protein
MRTFLTAGGLALLTVAVFWPATGYEFTGLDDPEYVSGNEHVLSGLTPENIRWAFSTLKQGNYHPVNWLSFQADASAWGRGPFGFHATNVLLHGGSAALLFLALQCLTGFYWRPLGVALLFAVHPLRVESVAWIAERKGVLSAFLAMLSLWAYAGYVRRPSAGRYAGTLLAFATSLLAKSALAPLPFLFLVLDWWQNRLSWRVVAEKVPLVALAVAGSVMGWYAQDQSRAVISLPPGERLANAVFRCGVYVQQTAWPANLAVYYPLPSYSYGTEAQPLAWPLALLLVGSVAALALRRRLPYLLVGWLWYLGMLVPATGLVQVGTQSHADRYTYFPQIGLLIAFVWGVAELPLGRLRPAVIALLAVCWVAATERQLPTWRDDTAMWDHAISVMPAASPIPVAYLLSRQDRLAQADRILEPAVRVHPDRADPWSQLSEVRLRQGRVAEALETGRRAVDLDPDLPGAWCGLGLAQAAAGDYAGAEVSLRRAVAQEPTLASAHAGLGGVAAKQGQWGEARDCFAEAVRLQPRSELYRGALRYAESKLSAGSKR